MQGFRCCQQGEIGRCLGGTFGDAMPHCGGGAQQADGASRGCGFWKVGPPLTECVGIGRGALLVMDVANHCKVTCTKGSVWVTGSNRGCDYILKAGESLLLQGKSKVIVSGGRNENVVWTCRS